MTERGRTTGWRFSIRQSIKGFSGLSLLKGVLLTGLFAGMFYRSFIAFFLLLPVSFFLAKQFRRREKARERNRVLQQFRDGILAISASIRAGHSAENSFRDAVEELTLLYGKNAKMTLEFERVVQRLKNNISLERAVSEMAERCEYPEIRDFSQVFQIGRRTGGRLVQMIQETVEIISGNIEVQEEIVTMLRGREYEQKVMKAIPILLFFYMDLSSPGYFSVLYDTLMGRLIMTACLSLYLAAWYLADRIAEVQI